MATVPPGSFYSTPGPRTVRPLLPSHSSAIPATPSSTVTPKPRAKQRTKFEKIEAICTLITKDFRSLGAFLAVLFHNRDFSQPDPRATNHKAMINGFLGGQSNISMGEIIQLIYSHPQSQPPKNSPQYPLAFSPPDVASPTDINFARPSLSTWALKLIASELRRQVGVLTQDDPTDPEDRTQLRASTNGRAKNVRLVTWDDIGKLSIPHIGSIYKRRARAVWYVTECMTAPMAKGVIVLRKRRPHPTVQVGAISSFIMSRNRYASGYLALPLSVWMFACKAHVDLKRVCSRFGFTVHDTTARACLDSLTDSSMTELRRSVAEGVAVGQMRWQLVLDNVQQFCRQRDLRLGRQDILKVGTAATALLLEDCAAGAFNLQDHLDRVMKQERRNLTTEDLYEDIDWSYIHDLTALHWVRILVNFLPRLSHLRKFVSDALSSEKMTKRRLRKRITGMQGLGTNGEREVETPGMMRALLDFKGQLGLDEKALEGLIFTPRGDGASIAAIWRIKKFLSAHTNHYKAFRHVVPAGPEIWHTRWTNLNAISTNHYGPSSSPDPSALSKSAIAAGAKRPSNLKKVDFFPTSRSLKLFFEARVLDCWRIFFDSDDITQVFAEPSCELPDLETLWDDARILVQRYASQKAYHQALSTEFTDSAEAKMRIPLGTPWTPPIQTSTTGAMDGGDGEEEEDEDEDGPPADELGEPEADEAEGFDGDRVLANEILFLQDMGMWAIADHAVPDGEIGRIWEILKAKQIWIFSFAGSGNRNYTTYLLETYCLHRYESSKDYSDALFNNWLISRNGKTFMECDWAQEDFNKWLEEMVEHKGGNFDDHFYRHTLAPNVLHFLRIKEQMESAFGLTHRGNDHGSPHLRNEFLQLLRMHKEDQLHFFRSKRSMGHAALNFLGRGYEALDDSRMDKFIDDSTAYSDIMKDVLSGGVEEDISDEEIQRKINEIFAEEAARGDRDGANADDDSDGEESVDGHGDVGVHGMDYSDAEESDDPDDLECDPGDVSEEQDYDSDGNEMDSELEEETIDRHVDAVSEEDGEM
ncbi:hypothetical protein C8J57DRAFT_1071083 [Mycena rebaudengoi]|nr:hypothetical protein C8J57DRAFT_1071083 [Mycena rebaudengoi]